MSTATAGRGDPYWYEWFVGLREVIGMIDEGSEITSVAFQLEGVKGWDDVVVKLADGSRRCYQVKHTREENSLTFSDLIRCTAEQGSLLGTLFIAWRESNLNDGRSRCILYTNRQAGAQGYKSDTGTYRPPLLKFYEWLQHSVVDIDSLANLKPPPEWTAALHEWTDRLAGPGVNDLERLAFIRAFQIRTDEDDLNGID